MFFVSYTFNMFLNIASFEINHLPGKHWEPPPHFLCYASNAFVLISLWLHTVNILPETLPVHWTIKPRRNFVVLKQNTKHQCRIPKVPLHIELHSLLERFIVASMGYKDMNKHYCILYSFKCKKKLDRKDSESEGKLEGVQCVI